MLPDESVDGRQRAHIGGPVLAKVDHAVPDLGDEDVRDCGLEREEKPGTGAEQQRRDGPDCFRPEMADHDDRSGFKSRQPDQKVLKLSRPSD